MSPRSVPLERFNTALQAPAMRAVGVISSTMPATITLSGIVIKAPCSVVIPQSSGNRAGKSLARTPSGVTVASIPFASNHGS